MDSGSRNSKNDTDGIYSRVAASRRCLAGAVEPADGQQRTSTIKSLHSIQLGAFISHDIPVATVAYYLVAFFTVTLLDRYETLASFLYARTGILPR